MATKEYWRIDNDGIAQSHDFTGVGDGLEDFRFRVSRLKDIYSCEETLRIEAYHGGRPCGWRVLRVSRLETDITGLLDIGIHLSRLEFIELRRIIQKHYYHLEPTLTEAIGNTVADGVVEGVVGLFREYVRDRFMEPRDGHYNIPTEEFKREFSESVFRGHSISDIKEALRVRGYTRCNARRNDFAIKEDGVNRRYISFNAERMGEA